MVLGSRGKCLVYGCWLVWHRTSILPLLAVSTQRGVFKSLTVLLAIFAFSLSLLGTFLVRSGVLTSVHSSPPIQRAGFLFSRFSVS